MKTKTEILDFLKENKEYFFYEYQITKIGLFGSYAVNQQKKRQ